MENEEEYYFSSNLKHLRKKHKVKQETIGNVCGKSKSSVSLWEKGERDVDIKDAKKISKYFNISLDDLTEKDLRVENDVQLDESHKVDHIIMDNVKELTDDDKRKLVGIIEVLKSNNEFNIKGSDNSK